MKNPSRSSAALPRPLRHPRRLARGAAALALLCALPAFAATSIVSPAVFSDGVHQYARGRILVEARAGLSRDDLDQLLALHGGKAQKLGQSTTHLVILPAGVSEQAVVRQLAAHPFLKAAQLDRLYQSTLAVNDPYIGSEWHIGKIGASTAWDTTQGAGITIAILDSGIEATHPDLAPNLVPGYNFIDNNTNVADICGHGTWVAGSAAARDSNGIGVAGVAPRAKIMPLRIAFPYNGTCYAYSSTIASGITYAADHGVRIANVSYGPLADDPAILSASQYMKSKNGLVFVSAANNGIDEQEAPSTSLIAVSATGTSDTITSWSSYGAFVSMSAPGEGIVTTGLNKSYGSVNGTSFASPITAGVAALMMAAAPSLDSTEIEAAMFSSARDLGVAGRDPLYGYGRVDANAAVQAALKTVILKDTQPPTSVITAPKANSTVKGNVTVAVTATDNLALDRVELRVNGTMVASDNAGPFSLIWNSTGVPNGMSTLLATAFDKAGNSTASAAVAVNVANPAPPIVKDKVKPVVKIDNPVAGNVSGAVTVSASATDNSGAAGITQELSIDNAVVAQGSGATLSYVWQTASVKLGSHTLKVVAKDAAGNSANATVKVKVTR